MLRIPPPIAFLYGAQNSISPSFGQVWKATESWHLVGEAQRITGLGLESILLGRAGEGVTDPVITSLLTFVCSLMVAETTIRFGTVPTFHAGYSGGQFSALAASGVITFRQGLELVIERSLAIAEASKEYAGLMMVAAEVDHSLMETICAHNEEAWISAYDSKRRVLLGGSSGAIENLCISLRNRTIGARTKVVRDAAIHTPLMEPAARNLRRLLRTLPLRRPSQRVFSIVDGNAYLDEGPLRLHLGNELTEPVQWCRTIENLEAAGVELAVEVGSASSLARLTRRASAGFDVCSVSTPDEARRVVRRGELEMSQTELWGAIGKVCVSPGAGVFRPDDLLGVGQRMAVGQILGWVNETEVRSCHEGTIRVVRAVAGERLREFEPIVWLDMLAQ